MRRDVKSWEETGGKRKEKGRKKQIFYFNLFSLILLQELKTVTL
jgi:hypothetical protein